MRTGKLGCDPGFRGSSPPQSTNNCFRYVYRDVRGKKMKKFITNESDLPKPIRGVIYLEAGTVIRGNLDLGGNRLSWKEGYSGGIPIIGSNKDDLGIDF